MSLPSSQSHPLSWDLFRVHNRNHHDAFQDLCKVLFARRLRLNPADLTEYHNQKGIEVSPVLVNGKRYSFQSKFSKNDTIPWSEFRVSLQNTAEDVAQGNCRLDVNFQFTNGNASKKNKKREEMRDLGNKYGITLKWIYGKAILETLDDPVNHDLHRKYFGGGHDLTLPLTEINPTNSLSALKYQARIAPLRGRERESAALDEFLKSKNQVLWWAMDAKSGQGKSRLALELCKKYNKEGWNCGFYRSGINKLELPHWAPERPHLIVCDHDLEKEQEVADLISFAHELDRCNKLPFAVRILLLEREAKPVIHRLKEQATVGPLIESCLHKPDPLMLSKLKPNDIEAVIRAYASHFRLSKRHTETVVEMLARPKIERPLVRAGSLCLYFLGVDTEVTPDSLEKEVRAGVEEERKEWNRQRIGPDEEEYLLLATMMNGIDLTQTEKFGPSALKFLKKFDFPEAYGKVVGQPAESYLAPLSHDLISELYVLDTLKPPTGLNKDLFRRIINLSLEIDHGKPLVAFFTKAANDFPQHSTLGCLLPQFNQAVDGVTIWLLIMANTIDKLPVPPSDKVALLSRVNRPPTGRQGELPINLRPIVDGIFIRLLRNLSGSQALDQWVGQYSIVDPKERSLDIPGPDRSSYSQHIPLVKVDENLLLYPDEYCRSVIDSFLALDKQYKDCFVGTQLFRCYSSRLLHQLLKKPSCLDGVVTTLMAMSATFPIGWEPGLASAFKDVIAGLFLWGHTTSAPDDTAEIVNAALQCLENRFDSAALPDDIQYLAGCYATSTTVLKQVGRSYATVKDIVIRFDNRYGALLEKSAYLSGQFVASSVALMYGFECQEDYDYTKKLLTRVRALTEIYPSAEIAKNLTLSAVQFARYQGKFGSGTDRNEVLNDCEKIARQYGHFSSEIIQQVLSEIINRHRDSVRVNAVLAKELFDRAISLIRHFKKDKLDKKIYVVGLIEQEQDRLFKAQDYVPLRKLGDIVAELEAIPFIDLHNLMTSIGGEWLKHWNGAENTGDDLQKRSIAETARHWMRIVKNTQYIEGVFSYILRKYEANER